jgi:hypothetical protein
MGQWMRRGDWRGLRLLAVAAGILALGGAGASVSWARAAAPQAANLDPETFASVASGVALIEIKTCADRPLASGTGFLVGDNVVMTARHVLNVKGGCHIRVYVDGVWHNGNRPVVWHSTGRSDAADVDMATFRLDHRSNGYVFEFANSLPPRKSTIAMVGHPLGGPISLSQGPLVAAGMVKGVPTMAVSFVTAEGSSGSPLLDKEGNVVGVLQRGFAREDAGMVFGINLMKPWGHGGASKRLCRAYPNAGIIGCGTPTVITLPPDPPPPPAPPAPPLPYHVKACWTQYTGNSWDNVNQSAAVTSLSANDLLTRGAENFWSVLELDPPSSAAISGVRKSLIQPNGLVFHTSDPTDWQAWSRRSATTLHWYWNSDGSLFFQHPEWTGSGAWTFRWTLPDGETCDSVVSIN